MHLNAPIVGMAATPDGKGYWLVASDGGIFTFGDAGFYGSTGRHPLNEPIVGMAATPDGKGYWLVASDGGIFTFGDAAVLRLDRAVHLNAPIVGMAATPDGKGYWLVASDGGIFTFGDAGFFGSAPGANARLGDIVAVSPASDGQGYWLAAGNGAVDSFGDATSDGSAAGTALNRPIVGFVATPPAIPSGEMSGTLVDCNHPAGLGGARIALFRIPVRHGRHGPLLLDTHSGIPSPRPRSLARRGHLGDAGRGGYLQLHGGGDGCHGAHPSHGHGDALDLRDAGAALDQDHIAAGCHRRGVVRGDARCSGWHRPYSWTLSDGSLPVGLALSPGGVITGTPTGQGSSTFTVQAIDATSPTPLAVSAILSIAVLAPSTSTTTVQSSNWSGYVELNGPFTSVTGAFSVPSLVQGTPHGDQMSEWVGIDGGTGDKG